jgi:hypothetical protein
MTGERKPFSKIGILRYPMRVLNGFAYLGRPQ